MHRRHHPLRRPVLPERLQGHLHHGGLRDHLEPHNGEHLRAPQPVLVGRPLHLEHRDAPCGCRHPGGRLPGGMRNSDAGPHGQPPCRPVQHRHILRSVLRRRHGHHRGRIVRGSRGRARDRLQRLLGRADPRRPHHPDIRQDKDDPCDPDPAGDCGLLLLQFDDHLSDGHHRR